LVVEKVTQIKTVAKVHEKTTGTKSVEHGNGKDGVRAIVHGGVRFDFGKAGGASLRNELAHVSAALGDVGGFVDDAVWTRFPVFGEAVFANLGSFGELRAHRSGTNLLRGSASG
jgi:hypothetical protein